jgi:hypothetical protein
MMTRHTVLSAMVFMSLVLLPVGSVQAAPVLFASGVAEGSTSSGAGPRLKTTADSVLYLFSADVVASAAGSSTVS